MYDPPERPRQHDMDKVADDRGDQRRFQKSNCEGWTPRTEKAEIYILDNRCTKRKVVDKTMTRELCDKDALMYLDQVKMEFVGHSQIYTEFLHIMMKFK